MRRSVLIPLFFLLLCCFVPAGCGSGTSPTEPPVFSPLQVLVPSADGKEVIGGPPLTLDISNKDQGYLMAIVEDGSSEMNIQLTDPEGVLYSYFLKPGETASIPFTGGDGSYQLMCYQQISGDQYAALYCETLDITLDNQFLPYLYPNQYVNFTPQSEASRLALSMLPEEATDLEALEAIFICVTEGVVYDYEKAENVEAGYLPDIDETLRTGKGICFDYAALMAAMLRSRDIPCKLQIGYASDVKHAWIDVYIRSKGWVKQAIAFDGEKWTRMDPTFESGSDGDEAIREYIGDGTNYTTQFSR